MRGPDLLGRHVVRCAEHRVHGRDAFSGAQGGVAGVVERFGHAEIGDHRDAVVEQHILRLDVAMHHPARMRIRKGQRHFTQQADGFWIRRRPPSHQQLPKRLPLDIRHAVPAHLITVTIGRHAGRAQQRYQMRVLQPRGELNFTTEPLGIDVGGELGRQHLQHNSTIERNFRSQKDVRRSCTTELALDDVRPLELSLKPSAQGARIDRYGGHHVVAWRGQPVNSTAVFFTG